MRCEDCGNEMTSILLFTCEKTGERLEKFYCEECDNSIMVPVEKNISLNELAKEVHKNAVEHGWWEKEREFGTLLMLMTSELAEAMEEYRNGHLPQEVYYNCNCGEKPEGVPIELADCIIRILDYCGRFGIDIDEAIRIKHEYNKTRPYKHGGKLI